MGNLGGRLRRRFERSMCLGAYTRPEVQPIETLEVESEEIEVFDGGAGGSIIDYLHGHGDYDDIPHGAGEPDLVWIYGGDEQWHLCAECIHCFALMTYPGSPHNCPEGDVFEGPIVTIPALYASATSLEVEGRSLICEESLDLSISDSEYPESGLFNSENTWD